MKRRYLLAALAASAIAAPAAAQSAFCAGFQAGWTSAYQNRRLIPDIPPICPIPPIGGNTYQAGYEMGLMAALQRIAQRRY